MKKAESLETPLESALDPTVVHHRRHRFLAQQISLNQRYLGQGQAALLALEIAMLLSHFWLITHLVNFHFPFEDTVDIGKIEERKRCPCEGYNHQNPKRKF